MSGLDYRCYCLALILVSLGHGAFAREIPITILHTCDLHGNILPTEDYAGRTNLGGLARCATAIREVRQHEKNVLVVDAGDTIQGTAASFLSDGLVMVKLLNLLRYDAWCWGNHEFDWGPDKLAACAERAEMPILNANVTGDLESDGPVKRVLARIAPYRVVEMDGIRVGIIGLNTPGIPNWSRPRLIRGLTFSDSVETLKRVVPEVRSQGARVIVLVCHQGFRDAGDDHANQINAIARNFPEIDVIIGGHTHRNIPEYKVRNILYCQADHFGIHLGRVDVVYDTGTGRVVRRESKTLLMDKSIVPDAEVLEVAGGELDRAAKTLSNVIGEAAGDFGVRGGPKRETPIHGLIFDSIAAALRERGVAVEAVVHGLLEERAALKKGRITVEDVWKIVPYENTLGVVQLLPGQLREILEEDAGAFGRREFRGIWGLKWTFDPSAPVGKRVISIARSSGAALEPDVRLAVAFNSYELASGGLRWKKLREIADLPETQLVEYDIQTRQAVLDYIRTQGTITPAIHGWWRSIPRSSPQ